MSAVQYQSFADAWETRATIRTRPRRWVENDDKLIFPMSRQPLVHSQTFLSHCRNCATLPWCRVSTNSSTMW